MRRTLPIRWLEWAEKPLPATQASHLGADLSPSCSSSHPASSFIPGKAAQGLWLLSPAWETQVDFQAPGSGLAWH